MTHPRHFYDFGTFRIDAAERLFFRDRRLIPLTPKVFDTLLLLVQNAGHVLEKDELMTSIWPDTVVEENNLNHNVCTLRKLLGEGAHDHSFIETIPRRGYRFVAEVTERHEACQPGNSPELEEAVNSRQLIVNSQEPAKVGQDQTEVASKAQADSLPSGQTRLPWLPKNTRWSLGMLARAAALAGVALLLGLAAWGWLLRGRAGPLFASRGEPQIHSIAVLPLENLSGDPAQEYFADGMTEELITEVAQVSSLRVISRTSVMQYKGTHKPLPVIAGELHVDAVVEGAVVRSGRKVRITAQLVQARDDRHLWANSYERDLGDIVTLQTEVAQAIVKQIEAKLTPQEQSSLARARRVNPQAYEAYLRGTFFWTRLTEDGLNKSIEYFNRAIELDPGHAESYAGLARSYYVLGILGFRPSVEVYPKAKAAALKALELDDTNAEAYNALAHVKKQYDRDWAGAESYYKRALELNPSYSVARGGYADYLSRVGRHEEAVAEAEKGRELDPLSARATAFLGYILYRARRYDEAVAQCQKAVELDPSSAMAHWFLGLAYTQKRQLPEAMAELEKAVEVSRNGPVYAGALGYAYAQAGQEAKALKVLDDLKARSKQRYVSPLDIAIVYVGLGDKNAAFQWLEKAYQERTVRLEHLPDPMFDSLRPDPRFNDLVRRIGLRP